MSSDLSRLIIGNTLTLGTGARPSFVCGRRFGKVCPSTAECFDLVRFMVASANVFPWADAPPSPGIDLYHFRRNDIKVLTFSLVSRSGVPSSLALRPRYSFSGFPDFLYVKRPQSSVFQLFKNSCSSYSANSGSFEEDLDLKREINTVLDPLTDQTIFI